jgi:hypothetical protein
VTKPDPIEIIEELLAKTGFDFAQELENDDLLADLISRSSAVGWGLDTYDILEAWSIEPGVGFYIHIQLDGEPDDDTSILGTSILAKVQGKAVKTGKRWAIAEYEVLKADFDPPDEYEDSIDQERLNAILSNTEFYHTFSSGISSLRVLNKSEQSDPNARKILKRQICINVITCLETYLSDAFVNTVLSNKKYLRLFFATFKDFKDRKLSMNELFDYADKAEEKAKEAMLEVIYHNLPKVSKMYEATLGISFPNFSQIQKDITIRHDLVHRNGKTKEGKEIFIGEADVNEIISRIENFVEALDSMLREKEKSEEVKRSPTDTDPKGFYSDDF